jgi:uncharacterized Zn-binding protein involved in type VI secretion
MRFVRGCEMRMKRRVLFATSIIIAGTIMLSGFGACKGVTLKLPNLPTMGKANQTNSAGDLQRQVAGVGLLTLELTYPAGQSPMVFTRGWVFGARCIVNPGKSDQKDISNLVQWSGSGSFEPAAGRVSHPSFSSEGSNNIILTVSAGGQSISTQYAVSAVSPANYAHVGTTAAGLCTHGCIACPHHVSGPIRTGSPNVLVEGKPAARVGDTGVHGEAQCCGPNTFEVISGDANVLIDGKPSARIGDRTRHCGGDGIIDPKAVIRQETIAISTPSEYFFAGDSVPINITVEYPQKARSAVIKFGDDGSELKLEPKSATITHVFKQGSWRVEAKLLDEQGAEIFPAETPLLFALGTSDCALKIEPETVSGEPGRYTFTEQHAFSEHPTLVWDIDGSPRQNGPQESFSADFKWPGQGTVTVTEMINGKPFCKATAYVTIKPPASQTPATTVPPLMIDRDTSTTTATTQNQGGGWYMDGAPVFQKNAYPKADCSYFGFNLSVSDGSATGSQSWKDCSTTTSKCGGTYTGTVTWTPPPSFMKPGSTVNFTVSQKTSAQNTCGDRGIGSWGALKVDGSTVVPGDSRVPTGSGTYTVRTGSAGAKMSIQVSLSVANLVGSATYNYIYR